MMYDYTKNMNKTWEMFTPNQNLRLVYKKCFSVLITNFVFSRRCGGLVIRVSASRLPVPGSILGPGPPHSVVCGAADHTVIPFKQILNPRPWWAVNL